MFGKIYIIRFYSSNEVYIGSTIDSINNRFYKHRYNFKTSINQLINNNYNNNWNVCYIELLEEIECVDLVQLREYEGNYIKKYKSDNNYIVINKNISGRNNIDYYIDNKNKIIDRINKYHTIKLNCCCGSKIRNGDIKRHSKTDKHINFINSP